MGLRMRSREASHSISRSPQRSCGDVRHENFRPGRFGALRRGPASRSRTPPRCKVTLEPRKRRREASRSCESHGDDHEARALFLMGLPGAGKTTVKRRRVSRMDLDIEPDRFKAMHPRYSEQMGEETDEEVHRWSVRRAADAFEDAIENPRRRSFVFDSSGSNARWLGRRIKAAREAGFTTQLLWVDVPVEVALLRNRDRATEQGRNGWCPEKVILDKADVMQKSFEELRKEADYVERLENWSPRNGELEVAKRDLHLYPAPRTRPPSLRLGDRGYGEAPPGAQSPSPTRGSMRTLTIGPWKRNDEVARKKNARLSWMDRTYRGNRERFVMENVLNRRETLVEPNAFPYMLPPGIEHWTIWCRHTMGHAELCDYIEGWLKARRPHNIVSWNYDDNRGRRTIDIWHVHIYFQAKDGQKPSITQELERRGKPSPRPKGARSPCSV